MMHATETRARPSLLLVEDTPSIQMLYRTVLTKAGYAPICASSGAEALALFEEHSPGVVLLDLMLPDIDGLDAMTQMLRHSPETRVIVVTANGSVNKAVEATRKGAHDFLVKPLGDVRLVGAVASAFADRRATAPTADRQADAQTHKHTVNFVAHCDQMQAVRTVMQAVARSKAPVFIHGASGTGKKTAAKAIHTLSPRASRPFVAFECGSLGGTDLETALFGTGPQAATYPDDSAGCAIRQAQGGTLLLQSPEALAPAHQARLLALLNDATISQSEQGSLSIDIRIICASSNDPHEAMRKGLLSEELFYRLFVLPLSLPPLQERAEDIPVLVDQFLPEIARQEGKNFSAIAADALAALQRLEWNGNMHELRNALRQAVVLHDGPELTLGMLPSDLLGRANHTPGDTLAAIDLKMKLAGLTLAEIEKHAIQAAIDRHGGSIPRAAEELDIAPSTIYRKRDGWTDPTP